LAHGHQIAVGFISLSLYFVFVTVDMFGYGGSLIAPDLVSTAAHCGSSLGDVIVGGYKSGSKANGRVQVATVKVAKHPKYNIKQYRQI
jgi:hypothetical protein